MHTVVVIAVFAAMVLAPCVVASFPGLFSRSGQDKEPEAAPPRDPAPRATRR